MRVILLTVLLLVLTISCFTEAWRDGEWLEDLLRRRQLLVRQEGEENGEPLNRIFDDFFNSKAWDVYIRYAINNGAPFSSQEELLMHMKGFWGFNLADPKDRRKFAISLYKVKSIDDLAKLMKAPPAFLHKFYRHMMQSYDNYGRINGLTHFFEIMIDYEDFVVQSGFPTLPLKGNTSNLIEEKFEGWHRKFFDSPMKSYGKYDLADSAKMLLLPVGQSPVMVVVPVQKARDTDQLLEVLCLKEDMYKLLHKDFDLDMHRHLKDMFATQLELITEMDRMGLTALN